MMQETNSSDSSKKKQKSPWTDKQIGAFWINKKDDKGQYLLGTIEIEGKAYPISIFANKFHQENTKRPHYVAFSNFSKEEVEKFKSNS